MRRLTIAFSFLAVAVTATVSAPAAPAGAATVTARQALGLLTVAAEAGASTYDRALFPHWVDADRDCQTTRAEVLIAESKTATTFTTSARCTVATGTWYSWYDGATWTAAADVDVDHVVALAEAWSSGARSWTTARRQAYANDIGVSYALEAVTDNVNQAKSDLDPAEWLPPLSSARCRYAISWTLVKYRWRLSVDSAEKRALTTLFTGTCGDTAVALPTRP